MSDHLPLITTLAAAFSLSLVFGLLAVRFKLPALIGYLVTGVIIGPFTPGYVADIQIGHELSEIGVMLLMFGVGLHFSLDDLMAVRRIALPGAILQIVVATVLGAVIATFWDWSLGGALVFGIALSVASTVVMLRTLESQGILDSLDGQIAVGWLIVEDLAMVLVLVILPPLAGWLGGAASEGSQGNILLTLIITLAKVSAFIALMLVVGRRVFPKLLCLVAGTGSREIFTLCVVAAALGIAYGASWLFGVSFALGAFFAGMVMRESEFSHRAAEESLPLREAFSVLFFVSVGMLFDPKVLLEQPLKVLVVVGIIVVGKSIAAAALVLLFRYPLKTALVVSASLAQIGEFSFILAALGVGYGLLPVEGQSLILAGALISIAINPLIFKASQYVYTRVGHEDFLPSRPRDHLSELPMTTQAHYLSQQVVLVGYGRIGQQIATALSAQGIHYVVVDRNRELVERLRATGIAAVSGDASEPAVLIQAHIARARMLVVSSPELFDMIKINEVTHSLNPNIEMVTCAQTEDEVKFLETAVFGQIFLGEHELSKGVANYVASFYKS